MLREKLAEMYESEHQWSKAAQMLSGIDLDSRIRVLDESTSCPNVSKVLNFMLRMMK